MEHKNVLLLCFRTSKQIIPTVEAFARVVFELKLQVYGYVFNNIPGIIWSKYMDVLISLHVFRLARPSQVSMGESWKGESAINSEKEIGTPVQYEFRVSWTYFFIYIYFSLESKSLTVHILYFSTDIKFGQTTQILCKHFPEHTLAQRECCREMVAVFDSCEQKRITVLPLFAQCWGQSTQTHQGKLSEHIYPNLINFMLLPKNVVYLNLKGWSHIQRKKREVEGELEPLSTKDIIFLPLKRKYKTLVSILTWQHSVTYMKQTTKKICV